MALFAVDANKCNRDGLCAAVCPLKIIAFSAANNGNGEGRGLPGPIDGAETLCINCGHCVAICPTAALSHRSMKPEDCLSVNTDWLLTPEQTEHFLRYRRSIRTYKDRPVPKESIESLIRIARYAPSGHNLQPVRWQIIYDKEDVRRLSGLAVDWLRYMVKEHPDMAKAMHFDLIVAAWDNGVDTLSRNAPHLILANGHKKDPTAANACTIAMTYLELAVPAFGLGACWNGLFNGAAMFWPPLQEALDLENQKNFAAMMIGYPRFQYRRLPTRNQPPIKWL